MEYSLDSEKRKIYATIGFVSMIAGGCYIGFGGRQETTDTFGNTIRRAGVVVRDTVEGNIREKVCLVDFIYREDISKVYQTGADTVGILGCIPLREDRK